MTPLDLAQLVHQTGLGVEPPGGVDDHHVGLVGDPADTASNATDAGSPALGAADHRDPDALAPRLELVGGGGPEGVRGAEDDGRAVADQRSGQLARPWWSCPSRSRRRPGATAGRPPGAEAWRVRSGGPGSIWVEQFGTEEGAHLPTGCGCRGPSRPRSSGPRPWPAPGRRRRRRRSGSPRSRPRPRRRDGSTGQQFEQPPAQGRLRARQPGPPGSCALRTRRQTLTSGSSTASAGAAGAEGRACRRPPPLPPRPAARGPAGSGLAAVAGSFSTGA